MPQALARTVALLLTPDSVHSADEVEATALAELRERLATCLGGRLEDALAEPGPETSPEQLRSAAMKLRGLLEADATLCADVGHLVDEASRPGRPAATLVAKVHAEQLEAVDRPDEALALYESVLGRHPDDLGALYRSAVCLRLLGRREEALERLRRVSTSPDPDADDQVMIAREFLLLEARDDAAGAADAAMTLREGAPLGDAATVELADVWSELGRANKALAVLDAIVTDQREDEASREELYAHLLAAALHYERGEPQATVDILKALEHRPGSLEREPLARMWLGLGLGEVARHHEALSVLDERLVEEVPAGARVLVLLGRGTALLGARDATQAERVLRDAVELAGAEHREVVHLHLGMALIQLHRLDEARSVLGEAAAGLADADEAVRGRVALWQAIAWQADEATLAARLAEADAWLPEGHPERPLLGFWQARAVMRHDPARSLALLDKIASPPADLRSGIAFARAIAHGTLGQFPEALVALDPAIDDKSPLSPQDRSWAWKIRAELHLASHQPDLALADIDHALTLSIDPSARETFIVTKAACVLESGQPHEALSLLREVGPSILGNVEPALRVLSLSARAAGAFQDPEELLSVLTEMAERAPAVRALADLMRANVLLQSNDLPEAFAVFRSLEDPSDAHNALGWSVAAMARQLAGHSGVSEALAHASELGAESSGPIDLLTGITRVMVAVETGDIQAVDAFLDTRTLPSELKPGLHLMRANALSKAGKRSEAIAALQEAEGEARQAGSEWSPTWRIQALAQEAILFLSDGNPSAAEQAVVRAEAVAKDSPGNSLAQGLTHVSRALLHLAREEHLDAEAAFERALDFAEEFPEGAGAAFVVEYLRGLNRLQTGEEFVEEALRWLRRAVGRRPDDPDALEALGEAYLSLEDPLAALRAFTAALDNMARGEAPDPERTASLLRAKAAAQRAAGYLEASLETSRESLALQPHDPRSWLSLGAAQLALGRHDPAAAAFGRGWKLRSHPSAPEDEGSPRNSHQPRGTGEVATQLLLGWSKALLDAGRAEDALKVLDGEAARHLAKENGLVDYNRAVAWSRLDRPREAVAALEASSRSTRPAPRAADLARQLAETQARLASWLGFWFGAATSSARKVVGTALLALGALALVPTLVTADAAPWVRWAAPGELRPLVPVAVVALLFFLPVVTRFKLGGVEIEQPAAAAPAVTELTAVGWDEVERALRRDGEARFARSMPGLLPGTTSLSETVLSRTVDTLGPVVFTARKTTLEFDTRSAALPATGEPNDLGRVVAGGGRNGLA